MSLSQSKMNDRTGGSKFPSITACWSIRLLILALIGILFLTLFPFRLSFHAHLPANRSPFFLGGRGKDATPFDAFLNVLLFVPFGFAVAERIRERGKSLAVAFVWALALGACLSYSIEFTQIYIPPRDSGWEDVITNSAGSVVGFILFELFGQAILRLLTASERAFSVLLTLSQSAWIISLYFVLWFAISIPMQMQTRLIDWQPNALLVVGNDASGDAPAWKGTVFRLQIWDRAISPGFARKINSGDAPEGSQSGMLAAYDFHSSSPFKDQMKFLPGLAWTSSSPEGTDPLDAALDGKSWLTSMVPVSNLVTAIQRTNQFAIRVVCSPAGTKGSDGRIVSISPRGGPANLQIRQDESSLVFWFRSPLTARHSLLSWSVPNVFTADRQRDILFSYNGSSLSLFLDGELDSHSYRLGPGVRLARMVRLVRPLELDGYTFVYNSFVFFVPGALLGIIARRIRWRFLPVLLFVVSGFLLPSFLFDLILVWVSGRPISPGYIALSLLLMVAGSLWINADQKAPVTMP
ncbi:MAG TPA: VanZ family protein [Candidatus Acidoferrales bacterium]|nr:VanZ family protein [Candidatus Acidoferrales bacterium]